MTRVWVDGPEGQTEWAGRVRRERARYCRRVGDGIALEVRVVDPEGIEAGVSGSPRPVDRVGDVAARGHSHTDAACQGSHVSLESSCLGGGPAGVVEWDHAGPETHRYVSGSRI